jgi:hypothetical protein
VILLMESVEFHAQSDGLATWSCEAGGLVTPNRFSILLHFDRGGAVQFLKPVKFWRDLSI